MAVIILLAAFLIAALLTTSSISKRVREIGTLRAIGWRKARVVRQIMAETIGIGIVGAVIGVLAGLGVAEAVNLFGPTLTSNASGLAVGASTASSLFHQPDNRVDDPVDPSSGGDHVHHGPPRSWFRDAGRPYCGSPRWLASGATVASDCLARFGRARHP